MSIRQFYRPHGDWRRPRQSPRQRVPLDRVFAALADPTRRAVLQRLRERPAQVSRLARPFGLALSSFMQHLRVLVEAGLVRTSKHGRIRVCHAAPYALREAEQWLARENAAWRERFDRWS